MRIPLYLQFQNGIVVAAISTPNNASNVCVRVGAIKKIELFNK